MQYPWIKEASNILASIVPCSRDEARAELMQRLTWRAVGVATRGRDNRRTAANRVLGHLLKKTFVEEDGIVRKANRTKNTLGSKVLETLKLNGKVNERDAGFAASSIRTYRTVLKKLKWIEVECNVWVWCGPADATWDAVEKSRRARARQTP